jgi:hypothetical protein
MDGAVDEERAEGMKTHVVGGVTVRVFPPVVIALSEAGETRWG